MGKKLLDNKVFYLVVAIVVSVGLWLYVCVIQGEQSTKQIENIPVTFVGTDVLQENNLMLLGETPTVDLEIRAGLTTLAKLDERSLTVRVDVSGLTGESDYTLSYEVLPPAGVSESSYTVVSRTPTNVAFTVVRYVTKEVPVRGALAAGSNIADGFVGRGFQFSQDTIAVSGLSDLVEQVQYARVTISGEDLSETVQQARTYQLIGVDEQVLDGLEVTCAPEYVETTYQIWKEIEVPLKVILLPGGGVSAEDSEYVSCAVEPSTVSVQGLPEDLESLKDLTVATIDLADVDGTMEFVREIPLADGLEISGGINSAAIRVTVEGLLSQGFQVARDSFTKINVPEGFTADVRTQSLAVTLRGTEEALEQASPDNIRVTVDLSNVEQVSGQYTVPAKVRFDGLDGVGVLGTDYQVVVRLTKQQSG